MIESGKASVRRRQAEHLVVNLSPVQIDVNVEWHLDSQWDCIACLQEI